MSTRAVAPGMEVRLSQPLWWGKYVYVRQWLGPSFDNTQQTPGLQPAPIDNDLVINHAKHSAGSYRLCCFAFDVIFCNCLSCFTFRLDIFTFAKPPLTSNSRTNNTFPLLGYAMHWLTLRCMPSPGRAVAGKVPVVVKLPDWVTHARRTAKIAQ